MIWYLYPIVVGAGFIAGVVNTLAGSGSLVTLPLLIFIGLPANVANGTNRVAILLQNVVGGSSFRRSGVLDLRAALMLGLPAMLGSVLGAQIAVGLDEELMRRVIGALLIVMLFVLLIRPNRWLHGSREWMEARPTLAQLVTFFGIGVYGGFIQAGVGLLLLTALVLSAGYDLVRANAVKVVVVLLFTVTALTVFVLNGQVDWTKGLVLAFGNMLGAWVAARFAVDRGALWVRRLLIAIVAISAAHLLGATEIIRLIP